MITYKVQHGDTLYTIAHRFKICVGMLALLNNIFEPHQIFEGQELLVPIAISNKDLNSRNHKAEYDLETIKKIFAQEGTTSGGVFKFTFPRFDLKARIDGIIIEPELALTSWVAFNQIGNHSMIMGDLVLLENEVGPVTSILKKNNIAVTAIHNHMLTEVPRLFFMHFWAVDKPEKLAQAFRSVLDLAK